MKPSQTQYFTNKTILKMQKKHSFIINNREFNLLTITLPHYDAQRSKRRHQDSRSEDIGNKVRNFTNNHCHNSNQSKFYPIKEKNKTN